MYFCIKVDVTVLFPSLLPYPRISYREILHGNCLNQNSIIYYTSSLYFYMFGMPNAMAWIFNLKYYHNLSVIHHSFCNMNEMRWYFRILEKKSSLREKTANLLIECSTVIILQIREANITVLCFRSHINYYHPEALLYLFNVLRNPLRIIGLIIIRNAKYAKRSAILYSALPAKNIQYKIN